MFRDYVRSWVRRWNKAPKVRPARSKGARLGVENLEERSLLNAGALDPTFGLGGKLTTPFAGASVARSVLPQAGGKAVVVGYTQNGAGRDFVLTRYDAVGNVDQSFGTMGKVTLDFGGDDLARAATQTADGHILVTGFSIQGGMLRTAVARLDANGNPDQNFGMMGKEVLPFAFNVETMSVVAQGDKIVVGGIVSVGAKEDLFMTRLDNTGKVDNTFGNFGGYSIYAASANADEIHALALAADGSIYAGGDTGNGVALDFLLAHYDKDGKLDTSFGNQGYRTLDLGGLDEITSLAVQGDGRVVAAGFADNNNKETFVVARYLANGMDDGSFGPGGHVVTPIGTSAQAHSVLVQADGRILVGGASDGDFAMARYTGDGNLDKSFGTGGVVKTDFAGGSDTGYGLGVLDNGRIVLAGSAQVGGQDAFAVARYENDTLQFSAPAYSVTEDAQMATIIVTRTGGNTGALTVMVTTADGSGKAGLNYTPVAMQLQFADGETSKTFTIPILQDGVGGDGDKTVLLKLTDPSTGATLGGQDQAVLTITDVAPPIPNGPMDVTAKVGVMQGKLRRKGKGRYRQQVTLTNTGGAALSGPVRLVLDGLSGKVKVNGQGKVVKDQKSLGSSVVVVVPDGGQLAAGGSMAVTLVFRAARASRIHYTPRVFAGQGLL
jgi:uncharacterized delta-60 repeat protein